MWHLLAGFFAHFLLLHSSNASLTLACKLVSSAAQIATALERGAAQEVNTPLEGSQRFCIDPQVLKATYVPFLNTLNDTVFPRTVIMCASLERSRSMNCSQDYFLNRSTPSQPF
jgi:hypothetical protein